MKTALAILAALCIFPNWTSAQTTSQTVPSDTLYAVVSRGANEQVWQTTSYKTLPSGQTISHVHQYTELATGLHYWSNGQWMDSKEEIDIQPNGTAAATKGQHQAYFPGDIYQGMIELVTPDGKRLQSRPLGLSYDDGTNTVLIAELTNSIGYLVGSNQIIYPDAFTDFKADLRYTYTKAGFEQDIILRESPLTPESYGLNPATARLQVLTEFFDPPQPAVTATTMPAQVGIVLSDEHLDFGVMKMMPGRAFLLGTDAHDGSVLVSKSWVTLEGRQFLVEEVPVDALADELAELPAPQTASTKSKVNSMLHMVSAKRLLPTQRLTKTSPGGHFKQVAQAVAPTRGLVLDYVTINTTQTNYVFRGDTTYYISGTFTSYKTNTFEGNAVLKFATNATINIIPGASNPTIKWGGSAYCPVIFTAKDDNSVGEIISGSTGNPSGYYGSPMLSLVSISPTPTFNGLRMSYAAEGMQFSGASANFYNAQFIKCQDGLVMAGASIFMGNALFSNTKTNFWFEGGVTVNGQNVTIDNANCLAQGQSTPSGSSLILTNCILSNISSLTNGVVAKSGNTNGFYKCPEFGSNPVTNTFNPFQSVGAGNYYLTNGCSFTNGFVGIDPTLLSALRQRTTFAPLLYSNLTFSANSNLIPRVQCDTNSNPTLGYHYDPLDFVMDNVAITNSTLTVSNGTAIACYNEPGIQLQDGSAMISAGTPLAPNWIVRYQSVQEQPLVLGGTNVSSGENVAAAPAIGPAPTGTFRLSKFACPAGGGSHFYDNGVTNYSSLLVQDCELYGGQNNFTGSTNTTATLKNNLFYRSSITAIATNLTSTLSLSNNLVYGTAVTLLQPTNTVWYAFNNDFDSCGITNSTLTNGYNGYVNSGGRLSPTNAHDVVLSSFTYTNGPLGNYYQFSTGFVDQGSTNANLVGLYHYTTQTSEAKETNSIVDIGYHYVALDANGNPVDSNTNGIPDYLEDANGNGLDDGGEAPWNFVSNGLMLWLRADAGITISSSNQISVWVDQSGNTNNATQGNVYDQPLYITNAINSLPVVWFSGTNNSSTTNSYFNLPNTLLSGAAGAEAFVVLKAASKNPSARQSLWEMGGAPLGGKSFPDTDGSIKDDFGSTSVQPVGIPTEPLDQFNIYEVSSQTNNWSAWLNGILLYQTNVNAVQFPTDNSVWPSFGWYVLGGSPFYSGEAGLPNYFAGEIAEVLIFNRALTTSERSSLKGYLNSKYGFVPQVAMTSPTNNAVFATGSNIGLSASAYEPGGGTIKQVEFFQGTNSLGVSTSSPYSMTWSNVAPGSLTTNLYALTACATGDNGLVATSTVINIVVYPPPAVSITNPANGTYFGIAPENISLGATASDITGIRQVQFFQGTNSLGVETNSPYGLLWSNVSAGNYSLTAVATGNDGLSTTSSVISAIVDVDTDGDGLGDLQEHLYGTNPNASDGFWLWVGMPSGYSSVP